jgi:hypothetical protein
MTDAGLARLVDLDLLISSLRGEANLADRPGQYGRLNAAADVVVDALEYIRRLTAERDALAAQLDALRARIDHIVDRYGDAHDARNCAVLHDLRALAADEGEAGARHPEVDRPIGFRRTGVDE